jgi:hypothetical protein
MSRKMNDFETSTPLSDLSRNREVLMMANSNVVHRSFFSSSSPKSRFNVVPSPPGVLTQFNNEKGGVMIMIRPGGFFPRERLCVRPAAVVESLDSPGPCVARREREREGEGPPFTTYICRPPSHSVHRLLP